MYAHATLLGLTCRIDCFGVLSEAGSDVFSASSYNQSVGHVSIVADHAEGVCQFFGQRLRRSCGHRRLQRRLRCRSDVGSDPSPPQRQAQRSHQGPRRAARCCGRAPAVAWSSDPSLSPSFWLSSCWAFASFTFASALAPYSHHFALHSCTCVAQKSSGAPAGRIRSRQALPDRSSLIDSFCLLDWADERRRRLSRRTTIMSERRYSGMARRLGSTHEAKSGIVTCWLRPESMQPAMRSATCQGSSTGDCGVQRGVVGPMAHEERIGRGGQRGAEVAGDLGRADN